MKTAPQPLTRTPETHQPQSIALKAYSITPAPERGIVQIRLLSHSVSFGTKDVSLRGRRSGLGCRRHGSVTKPLEGAEPGFPGTVSPIRGPRRAWRERSRRRRHCRVAQLILGSSLGAYIRFQGAQESAQTLSRTSSGLGHRRGRCTWLRGCWARSCFCVSPLCSFPLMLGHPWA